MNGLQKIRSIVFKHATTIFIIILAIFVYVRMPLFFTPTSLLNLSSQAAIFGTVTIGMTFLMITRVADISLGAQVYLGGIIGVRVYLATGNMFFTLLASMVVCLIASTINGICIVKYGIPDMITTMSMQFICNGIANLIVGKESVVNVADQKFQALGQSRFSGLPVSVWFLFGLMLIGGLLLHKTKFGRYVYAAGNNPDALEASGINVFMVRMSTFWISGALAGFAGIVNVSRLGGATFALAKGLEFTCIAACSVGGISMLGGSGTMYGSLLGVAIIASINQLLRLFNVSSYLCNFVWGIVVIFTVSMDLLKRYQMRYERERKGVEKQTVKT